MRAHLTEVSPGDLAQPRVALLDTAGDNQPHTKEMLPWVAGMLAVPSGRPVWWWGFGDRGCWRRGASPRTLCPARRRAGACFLVGTAGTELEVG